MTGRNCVAVDIDEPCVRAMLYRMMSVKSLHGAHSECGIKDNTPNEGGGDESEDEAEQPVGE